MGRRNAGTVPSASSASTVQSLSQGPSRIDARQEKPGEPSESSNQMVQAGAVANKTVQRSPSSSSSQTSSDEDGNPKPSGDVDGDEYSGCGKLCWKAEMYNKLLKEERDKSMVIQTQLLAKCDEVNDLKKLNEECKGKEFVKKVKKIYEKSQSTEEENLQLKNQVMELKTELTNNQISLKKMVENFTKCSDELETSKRQIINLEKLQESLESQLKVKECLNVDLQKSLMESTKSKLVDESTIHSNSKAMTDLFQKHFKEVESAILSTLKDMNQQLISSIDKLAKYNPLFTDANQKIIEAINEASEGFKSILKHVETQREQTASLPTVAMEQLAERIRHLTKENESLKKLEDKLTDDLRGQEVRHNEMKENYEKEIELLKRQLTENSDKLKELEKKDKELSQIRITLENQVLSLSGQLVEKCDRMSELESKLDHLKGQNFELTMMKVAKEEKSTQTEGNSTTKETVTTTSSPATPLPKKRGRKPKNYDYGVALGLRSHSPEILTESISNGTTKKEAVAQIKVVSNVANENEMDTSGQKSTEPEVIKAVTIERGRGKRRKRMDSLLNRRNVSNEAGSESSRGNQLKS